MAFEKKLNVVVDFDDVLASCNGYALELLSTEVGKKFDINDVTQWGVSGKPVDGRLKYFREPSFFETQPALPGAASFLDSLMEKADVTIVTAVPPEFMGERVARIAKLFPRFPLSRVIMGERKDVVASDVMLDDGLHNLVDSNARLPVVYDRPWNRNVSGMCRVKGYDEFLTLVDFLNGKKAATVGLPKVVCLLGPSGSCKHEVADELCRLPGFGRAKSVTTMRHPGTKERVDEGSFLTMEESGRFLTYTRYGGESYGVLKEDVSEILDSGKNAVAVLDVSGCLEAYNAYPGRCVVVYLDRGKRACVESVLRKTGLGISQVADRIMSIDYERKSSVVADFVIHVDEKDFAERAKEIAARIG